MIYFACLVILLFWIFYTFKVVKKVRKAHYLAKLALPKNEEEAKEYAPVVFNQF